MDDAEKSLTFSYPLLIQRLVAAALILFAAFGLLRTDAGQLPGVLVSGLCGLVMIGLMLMAVRVLGHHYMMAHIVIVLNLDGGRRAVLLCDLRSVFRLFTPHFVIAHGCRRRLLGVGIGLGALGCAPCIRGAVLYARVL